MKVVLRRELENLGEIDDVVTVADGYARNYLLPKNLAVVATDKELKAVDSRKEMRAKQLAEKKAKLEEQAKKLAGLELGFTVKTGEAGKLFGSITVADIAQEIKKAAGLEVDKKKIELNEPIKAAGEYQATVKLYQDIQAEIKIKIEAQAEE